MKNSWVVRYSIFTDYIYIYIYLHTLKNVENNQKKKTYINHNSNIK